MEEKGMRVCASKNRKEKKKIELAYFGPPSMARILTADFGLVSQRR